jgi:hypothetical protein
MSGEFAGSDMQVLRNHEMHEKHEKHWLCEDPQRSFRVFRRVRGFLTQVLVNFGLVCRARVWHFG